MAIAKFQFMESLELFFFLSWYQGINNKKLARNCSLQAATNMIWYNPDVQISLPYPVPSI